MSLKERYVGLGYVLNIDLSLKERPSVLMGKNMKNEI